MKWWRLWRVLFVLAAVAAAAGCGGGGGGGGGSSAVTVTIAPKTVTVIVNGTVQFGASVTGSGVTVGTIAATSGAVRAANVVTITTTSPHGLTVGQIVTISGVTDTSFNGTFAVLAVPSTTTFTYAQSGSDATSGSGTVNTNTVKWFVNSVEGGVAATGTISTTGDRKSVV